MNPLIPQALKSSPRRQRAVRAFTAFALMAVLFASRSVQAEPVRIHQVVQTLSTYQGPADIRLGTITTQDPSKPSTTNNGSGNGGPVDPTVAVPGGSAALPVLQDPQQLGVEYIEEAEVEGSICDCGYIPVPDGFPKWPLLFLTAVPFIFINDCDDCDNNTTDPTPTPTPTPPPPTPTPTPTPEPASLLLFGTGLLAAGAGLRRRYKRARVVDQVKAEAGEE